MSITFSRGEESKSKVLMAALELFIEHGYEKTTMRQIVQRSGVLNGSVYHAFKNKDGIFEQIFSMIFYRIMDDFETEETDAVTYLMFPPALELYFSSVDKKVAELLYHANRSWSIFNGITEEFVKYYSDYGKRMGWPLDAKKVRRYILAVEGILSTFVSEYYLTDEDVPLKENLRFIVDYISATLHIPVISSDKTLDKVIEVVKEKGERILDDLFNKSPRPDCAART